MTHKPSLKGLIVTLSAVAAVLMTACAAWAAPKYKALHAFGNGQDGAGTWGSLLRDSQGNLYGTTGGGGLYGYGTAFELTPQSGGKWSESILHNFDRNGHDGYGSTANLIFGGGGSLYGTTTYGGDYGYGTVFELTPGSGGWSETVLFSFDATNGGGPYGGVAIGPDGNLYGTAGIAFELTRTSGEWTESVLHRFSGKHGDGNGPFAGLILDGHGNLYGTTRNGGKKCSGDSSCGTVYELSPLAGGGWEEAVLFRFDSYDGAWPGLGTLAMDGSGNLYGTTVNGGCCGGTVFRLTPQADGRWKETVLHDFEQGASGFEPGAGVVRNKAGNLYGTTIYGGSPNCDCGVVYKLSPKKNGKWKYTVLHTFVGSDGAQPDANLILDDKGNLYGTAATGGQYGAGVVFEVTP
jgi:uncharacterized repeat protein (TIGR03803 family)